MADALRKSASPNETCPQPDPAFLCRALLAEQGQELRELRERLDDALDGREQAEIRADAAEAALGLTGGRCAAERSLP